MLRLFFLEGLSMSWRDELRPASFRGAPFHVEANNFASGRRGISYEFPKRDDTLDEDMGRRVRRRAVTGYVIGPDYQDQAEALERALETEGGGLLVLPLMGQQVMRCDGFNRSERKTNMGEAVFEMTFVAAGQATFSLYGADTQSLVNTAVNTARNAVRQAASDAARWIGLP
ncbi:DNA circularization N-terminal domain-containing protein [Methylobacterium dankookense]|uniref:DNA circulation N-terminal domain-containing protein n=1 Tax=Methylobacterium dankookense TaxID=560405 RepID=A0A564G536_9HYPH|nr:DNA circularization N-terminal domain-containing protein [Methylobacterium dankookense]GJD58350.1 hypothetical protein IFDJLNFL_4269 [Methylobacterium dankookense]VUF15645.1 hypothetical protein MTDSW087_05389 [Methylobacterium dankookense]